jgi:hypothetical protein
MKYTATLDDLYTILNDLNYQRSNKTTPMSTADLDEFYKRLQLTLSETNAAWSDKRTKELSAKVAGTPGKATETPG